MTGRWSKNKTKKPLETSLGQAPKEADKVVDQSHLQKPITTSVHGLKQVLSLFQTATNEVQEYITYECEVLYECRICRTIFRSLANFILHKRSYCKEKYNHLGGANPENLGGFVVEEEGIKEDRRSTTPEQNEEKGCTSPIAPQDPSEEPKKNEKAILPIIDKLVKKQEINILAKNTLNEDLSTKASDDDVVFVSEESNMVLQKIDTSDAAMFQTSVNDAQVFRSNPALMKSEVMEIHGILDNNEVVLGSNGKVCTFETNKKLFKSNVPKLVCTECDFTFMTEKTFTHHIKYKHNKTCTVYPCPDCKETFANAWSVYRHLYKVHRRTTAQVRKLRALIHSSGIRKDQEPEKKKEKTQAKESEENQWMNNFEGDKDLQMCGGCGKRFERKAALHSHSQMCTKRIALCNSLKSKSAVGKAKVIEKIDKLNGVKLVKGSARRKPSTVFMHKSSSNGEDKAKIASSLNVEASNVNGHEEPSKESKKSIDIRYSEKEIIRRLNKKGTLVAKLTPNAEKVSEVIIDSDDEKENDKQIIKNGIEGDVTITKYNEEEEEEAKPQNSLPEIEIFTISDESSDETEKKTLSKREEAPPKKRKRAASLDIDSKVMIADEYKEYLNDDLDHCFFTKALPYIDKNELKCVPCQSTYLSQYQLLWHMSLHFSWFRFQCSKCSFMSFNKYDCTTHAYSHHGTPNNLIGSTVLPIPKWKVLLAAHKFTELSDEVINNNMIKPVSTETDDKFDDSNKPMPCLEAITAKYDTTEDSSIDKKDDFSQISAPSSETIVVEDDEMPDICHDNAHMSDTVVLSDDEGRENKREKEKAGPSKSQSVAKNRPIRNRTKSVKTVQNDFIYDLAKVLKLNDNSIKSSKFKKNLNKSLKE